MNLLRIAIAGLLLPAGAQLAQAADVSRMAVTTNKQPLVVVPMAPDVAKTPGGPRPFVPVPLPGTAVTPKDQPVPKVNKIDAITIKQGAMTRSTGNEPGTLKGIVAPQHKDRRVMLNPLDSLPAKKAEQLEDASKK